MSNPHAEHGLTQKPSFMSRIAIPILLAVTLVSVFLLGQHWDNTDDLEEQIINTQLAHSAERAQVEEETINRVALAYEQGQQDALRALESHPKGIELAQACEAWWHRNDLRFAEPGTAVSQASTFNSKRTGS